MGRNKNNNNSEGVKIFVNIPESLNKKIRAFRHQIYSDRFNAALVDLLFLGIEKSKESGVIEELTKKYLKEDC